MTSRRAPHSPSSCNQQRDAMATAAVTAATRGRTDRAPRRSSPRPPRTTSPARVQCRTWNPRIERASGARTASDASGQTNTLIVCWPRRIDERRGRPPGDVVEPAAGERESEPGEIVDRRGEVQLAEKPRLHGVLIGGPHIKEVLTHQRAHVTVDDRLCHRVDRLQRAASTASRPAASRPARRPATAAAAQANRRDIHARRRARLRDPLPQRGQAPE